MLRRGLGNESLHQVSPRFLLVPEDPHQDSWLNFSREHQWNAFLIRKCPGSFWAFIPFWVRGREWRETYQAFPRYLCFPSPMRASATGEEWGFRGSLWRDVPAVPKVSFHLASLMSGKKLGRGEKSIVKWCVCWVLFSRSIQGMFICSSCVCYSCARVNHSAARQSSSPF